MRYLEKIRSVEDRPILFASECSSRTWGFSREDSDYDVRIVYAEPKDYYSTISAKDSSTRHKIYRAPYQGGSDEDVEVSGWDLRKTFKLLRGSNPAIIETLLSPIVYTPKDQFYLTMRGLAQECFNPLAYYWHHMNMLKNMVHRARESDGDIEVKKYVYAIRSFYTCSYMLEYGSIPPFDMVRLSTAYDDSHPVNNYSDVLDPWVRLAREGVKTAPRSSEDDPEVSFQVELTENILMDLSHIKDPYIEAKKPDIDLDQFFRETVNGLTA